MPWNATPTKSITDSNPASGIRQSSPAWIIMCSAGLGFSIDERTASSREQLTDSPAMTHAAASRRFSGVIRLSAPRSSSAPQRPQFLTAS